jgi:hypothetical protein
MERLAARPACHVFKDFSPRFYGCAQAETRCRAAKIAKIAKQK